MKKLLVCIGCILMFFNASVLAAAPSKVAIVTVNHSPDIFIRDTIVERTSQYFKTPLSSIVKVYEIIPERDLPKSMPRFSKDSFRALSEGTGADIWVVTELNTYRTISYTTYIGERRQETTIEMRIHIYRKGSDQYITRKISRDYNGDETTMSGLDYLLDDALYEMETQLRKYIPFKPKVD